MDNAIVFKGIRKQYGEEVVIDNLDMEIPRGNIVVLIGPSGCGKTTTLKMINRLIEPSAGNIIVNGKDAMSVSAVQLRRGIGYVIQQIGLMPHMTVADNIALVPRISKGKKHVDQAKIDRMLEMVGLDPRTYRNRYPFELSGGQQQRIGVARALMNDPEIILMDEPFSALDPITREQLQDELIKLNEELHKTIVFVTHDMDEALKIADQIVVMHEGKIAQQGTPDQILRHPASDFVRDFIGEKRLASRLTLLVDDVMLKNPVTILPTRGLAEAVQLMQRRRVTGLVVVQTTGGYLGVANAGDIYKHYPDETLTVADIVRKELPVLQTGTPLTDAIPLVQQSLYGYLPVLTPEGSLAGLLTRASIVEVLAKPYLMEVI